MKTLQAALEYIAILGIVLTFIIPLWMYTISLHQQARTELSLSYAENAVKQIADTASLVYSQGPPAKVSLRVYIPTGVMNISMINTTIIFNVSTSFGYTNVFAISDAKLNGSVPTEEGYHLLSIEAKNDYVQIMAV